MSKLIWFIKRVSVMSPSEFLFRIFEQLQILSMYLRFRLDSSVIRNVDPNHCQFSQFSDTYFPQHSWLPVDTQTFDAIMDLKLPLFGKDWLWQPPEGEDRWLAAPDSGNVWPKVFFHNIGFRSGSKQGDIRIVWEATRFQHFIAIARYIQTEELSRDQLERAILLIKNDLSLWRSACPIYVGPHYISSMECALRIISLSLSLDIVRQHIKEQSIWSDYFKIVGEHADFILERLSLHSSSGNHTLAETLGLIVAASVYPEHRNAEQWLTKGLSIFSEEFKRQIGEEGEGIEQAIWYTRQIIEYAILYMSIKEKYDLDRFPCVRKELNLAIKNYRDTISSSGGYMFLRGDTDSGYAISYYFNAIESIGASAGEPAKHIEKKGYTAISNGDKPGEKQLGFIMDHGPLGMPPSFGHGHADALSVCVAVDGVPLFSDPGSYYYTGNAEGRNFFRSTLAHNCICVDGKDQAIPKLPFMWESPYVCDVTFRGWLDEDLYCVSSCHSGYEHMGVKHQRTVYYDLNRGIVIVDKLSVDGFHGFEMRWNHVWKSTRLQCGGFLCGKSGIYFKFFGGQHEIQHGSTRGGWFSDCYSKKFPIDTHRVICQTNKDHEFKTVIAFEQADLDGEFVEARI